MSLSERLMEVISGAQEAAAEREEQKWAEMATEEYVRERIFERLCEGESVCVLRVWHVYQPGDEADAEKRWDERSAKSMTFYARNIESHRRKWSWIAQKMAGRPWRWRIDWEKSVRFGTKQSESGEVEG